MTIDTIDAIRASCPRVAETLLRSPEQNTYPMAVLMGYDGDAQSYRLDVASGRVDELRIARWGFDFTRGTSSDAWQTGIGIAVAVPTLDTIIGTSSELAAFSFMGVAVAAVVYSAWSLFCAEKDWASDCKNIRSLNSFS